jgi:hypothetical protein
LFFCCNDRVEKAAFQKRPKKAKKTTFQKGQKVPKGQKRPGINVMIKKIVSPKKLDK